MGSFSFISIDQNPHCTVTERTVIRKVNALGFFFTFFLLVCQKINIKRQSLL